MAPVVETALPTKESRYRYEEGYGCENVYLTSLLGENRITAQWNSYCSSEHKGDHIYCSGGN
jgi:hypothetical protein